MGLGSLDIHVGKIENSAIPAQDIHRYNINVSVNGKVIRPLEVHIRENLRDLELGRFLSKT